MHFSSICPDGFLWGQERAIQLYTYKIQNGVDK